jgi:hypothetical protein
VEIIKVADVADNHMKVLAGALFYCFSTIAAVTDLLLTGQIPLQGLGVRKVK